MPAALCRSQPGARGRSGRAGAGSAGARGRDPADRRGADPGPGTGRRHGPPSGARPVRRRAGAATAPRGSRVRRRTAGAGYDERGREVLEFVEGEVPAGPPYALSDARLLSAARLIRRFHDATVSSPLCRGQEVVCHGDLGAHNTVFRGEQAVALIDWDAGLAPGRRTVDFAHAVWCFADLTEDAVPVAEQARRTRLMCAAYPGMTPRLVVDELTARFHRARPARGCRAGRRSRGLRPAAGLGAGPRRGDRR